VTYNVFGGTLNFAQHQFKVKGEGHSKIFRWRHSNWQLTVDDHLIYCWCEL